MLCIALGICSLNLSIELLVNENSDLGIKPARRSLAKSHGEMTASIAQLQEEDEAEDKERQEDEPVGKEEEEEEAVPAKASSTPTGTNS
jgi:hypothetical protein